MDNLERIFGLEAVKNYDGYKIRYRLDDDHHTQGYLHVENVTHRSPSIALAEDFTTVLQKRMDNDWIVYVLDGSMFLFPTKSDCERAIKMIYETLAILRKE
jgi:hypothetical protein